MSLAAARAWLVGFVKHERQTSPRLLPLWAIAFVALAGYQPGSTAWLLSATVAVLLGVMVVPLVGSISPTVTAYLTLLVAVVGMLAISAWLPLHEWYDKAWLDQGTTGALAMTLLGAAVLGGFTSVVWAALVLIEATRRAVRRFRTGSALPPGSAPPAGPIALVPGARRPRRWPRRLYMTVLCLALALPLPSFMLMSGVFVRPMAGPHAGAGGFIGDVVTAATWPVLATFWLSLGALISWLLETRAVVKSVWALAAFAVLAVVVVIVLLSASTFAVTPGEGAQGFAASVTDYCPGTTRACQPAWLFSVPRLAELTSRATPWVVTATVLATAAVAFLSWRKRAA